MNALVIGGARCLHADLEAIGPWSGLVIGVNDAAAVYPGRLDHFATLHPEKLANNPDRENGVGWIEERRRAGGNMDFVTWTHNYKVGLADREITGWTNGSSGLLAVGVAFEMGCETVLLAGVPMDPQPHFFDRTPWLSHMTHAPHWEERIDLLRGRVFSCSGWTRELLGPPPAELLQGGSQ